MCVCPLTDRNILVASCSTYSAAAPGNPPPWRDVIRICVGDCANRVRNIGIYLHVGILGDDDSVGQILRLAFIARVSLRVSIYTTSFPSWYYYTHCYNTCPPLIRRPTAMLLFYYQFRRFADWWERDDVPGESVSRWRFCNNIALYRRVRPVGHGIYQTDTAFPYYYYYYYYYHYHGSYYYLHCRRYYYYCCRYCCATTRPTDRNRTGRALKHISLKTHIRCSDKTGEPIVHVLCRRFILLPRFHELDRHYCPEDYLPKSAHIRSLDLRRSENLYR